MSTKRRIKLTVAYDGCDFCGWAPQRGRRTVHGTLTELVRQVSGEDIEIIGASRTDSGANARGQVCHFDTETPFPDEKWVHVLNQELPLDLAVVRADRVDPLFHSRFWALHRYYRYRIQVGVRDPLRNRQVFSYPKPLDFEAMKEAAKALPGTHDFLAFSQLVDPKKSTVRKLHTVELSQVRDEIRIDIVGSAFVRGMMRRISGALWDIGRGARPVEEIENLLTQRDKKTIKWPTVLPARGLCLMKVSYGRHPKPQVKLHKKEFLAEEDSDE